MAANASQQLYLIGARCRTAASGPAIKRRMSRGIRAGAQPLVSSVKAAAGRQLPQSGGLAARVAGERVTVSVLTGARTAGVRMRVKHHDAQTTDSGYVRHPVFGTWVEGQPSQPIPAARGWWTETLRRESPAITPILLAEMEKIAAEIRGI